jgi:hypothetical protein
MLINGIVKDFTKNKKKRKFHPAMTYKKEKKKIQLGFC